MYCETGSGRQFIVEMQNSWKPFFKDRTLYYAAKAIRDQGVKDDPTGREQADEDDKPKKWNYRLNEVYLVAVMNFNFPKTEYPPDDYCHKVMLSDIDDHHVFYKKLTLIYLEMPKVGKARLDMGRPLDRWLLVLYRLWGGEECPPELDEPVFRKLYEQAEYARFTPNQQLTYERSRKYELDTINEIRGGRILGHEEGFAEGHEKGLAEGHEKGLAEGHEKGLAEGLEKGLAEGHEKGLAEGREKGLAEGVEKSKLEIAKRMKEQGFDKDVIFQLTGIAVS